MFMIASLRSSGSRFRRASLLVGGLFILLIPLLLMSTAPVAPVGAAPLAQTSEAGWSSVCSAETVQVTGVDMIKTEDQSLAVADDASWVLIQQAGGGFRIDPPTSATFTFADGTSTTSSEPTRFINEVPDVSPWMMGYTFEVPGQPGENAVALDDADSAAEALVAYSIVPAEREYSTVVDTTLKYTWGGTDGRGALPPAELTLQLPEPLPEAADVQVQAVVIDKEVPSQQDQRIVIVRAEAGGVVVEQIVSQPDEPEFAIVRLNLPGVPAGTENVHISVISPETPSGQSQWYNPDAGDSIFLIGGTASVPCPLPTATPTETSEPATSTPTATPAPVRVFLQKQWLNELGEDYVPSPALLKSVTIRATSSLGSATCTFDDADDVLDCNYFDGNGNPVAPSEGLQVPQGGTYAVDEEGLPTGIQVTCVGSAFETEVGGEQQCRRFLDQTTIEHTVTNIVNTATVCPSGLFVLAGVDDGQIIVPPTTLTIQAQSDDADPPTRMRFSLTGETTGGDPIAIPAPYNQPSVDTTLPLSAFESAGGLVVDESFEDGFYTLTAVALNGNNDVCGDPVQVSFRVDSNGGGTPVESWTGEFTERSVCTIAGNTIEVKGQVTLSPPGSVGMLQMSWQLIEPEQGPVNLSTQTIVGQGGFTITADWPGFGEADTERRTLLFVVTVLDNNDNPIGNPMTYEFSFTPEECIFDDGSIGGGIPSSISMPDGDGDTPGGDPDDDKKPEQSSGTTLYLPMIRYR